MPNNYVLLERIELNASAASIVFANIPQTGYTDLKIVVSARNTSPSVYGIFYLYFNGSTANCSSRFIEGTGASVYSATTTVGVYLGPGVGATATANTFSNIEAYIPNYVSSNYKSVSVDSVGENNATTAYTNLTAGLWSSTSAITSLTIDGTGGGSGYSFIAGSTFSLYGLAALGTTPAIAPKASGGNIIATDGTYWYHAFLASGTFTPQVGLTADVLQVAGGAGGGTNWGAGGGAGGLLAFTNQTLVSNTSLSVAIGAGGSASTSGSNSQFASLTTSVGGGRGGIENFPVPNALANGGSGGSGGGGGRGSTAGTGGAASPSGQGNSGGNGSTNSAGGGGGAAGGGASASSSTGGAGGSASSAYSSWLSATSMGVSGAIAGGGGGMSSLGGATGGAGGGGGAGAGADGGFNSGNAGVSATANTGSGGGGGAGASGAGGAGGAGIIIVRYPIA
jgi:hypothetical protein